MVYSVFVYSKSNNLIKIDNNDTLITIYIKVKEMLYEKYNMVVSENNIKLSRSNGDLINEADIGLIRNNLLPVFISIVPIKCCIHKY